MKRPATRIRDIQKHLMRSLGRTLIVSERLTTTLTRVKALRPIVERWITLAKRASVSDGAAKLAFERRLRADIGDTALIRKLVDDLAKRTATRPGGYTRILKLGYRTGDAAPKALIEFVDKPAKTVKKTEKSPATIKSAPAKVATKAGK